MRHIIEAAREVRRKFRGRDIFETAENCGANVWFRELGGLKGFYISENEKRYIVINEQLDEVMSRVVCAHELGHDMLHRELSAGGIRENTLFLHSNKTEREANLFAAELLVSDKDILSELDYCDSAESLSCVLSLPVEIIMYKLEIMNREGYHFNVSSPDSGFLK